MRHACNLYPKVPRSDNAAAIVILSLPDFFQETAAVLIHNTGQVRDDGSKKPTYWGAPSGGIKLGEEPEQTVLRELLQETKLSPTGESIFLGWRHSFKFGEDNSPIYKQCNKVVEAVRMGLVDEREIVHQAFAYFYHIPSELNDALYYEFFERFKNCIVARLGAGLPMDEEEVGGALVVPLDHGKGKELGIVEAIEGPGKRQEIDKIGLFPISRIRQILSAKVGGGGVSGFSSAHLTNCLRVADQLVQER